MHAIRLLELSEDGVWGRRNIGSCDSAMMPKDSSVVLRYWMDHLKRLVGKHAMNCQAAI